MREKEMDGATWTKEAAAIQAVAGRYRIPFLVNDSVEVAAAVGADGVHLGQSDGSVAAARKMLGPERIIGVSAHNVPLALAAEKEGADYIGVGAIFPTATKGDAATVSLPELQEICRAVKIPVVAIGGIREDNLHRLAGSGIDGIAVVSALFAADDIEAAARRLRRLLPFGKEEENR